MVRLLPPLYVESLLHLLCAPAYILKAKTARPKDWKYDKDHYVLLPDPICARLPVLDGYRLYHHLSGYRPDRIPSSTVDMQLLRPVQRKS